MHQGPFELRETPMTADPRLPTLEEVMNGNPFDIIDSPWGHIERWRASTLATGTMGALESVFDAVRADSAAATARADADKARVAVFKDLLQKIDALTSRCDALASEVEAVKAEAKRKADDEARAREFENEPLALPPEPDDPTELKDAAEHHPPGELHDLPPVGRAGCDACARCTSASVRHPRRQQSPSPVPGRRPRLGIRVVGGHA
jgi:hypothetical protein